MEKFWLTRKVSLPHPLGNIDTVVDDGAARAERFIQGHAQQDDTVVKSPDEEVDLAPRQEEKVC